MKRWIFAILFVPAISHADGLTSTINPRVLLRTTSTWTATQTFVGSTTFVSATISIGGISYVFPAVQAPGCLSNDGSGNLSWQTCGSGGGGGGGSLAYLNSAGNFIAISSLSFPSLLALSGGGMTTFYIAGSTFNWTATQVFLSSVTIASGAFNFTPSSGMIKVPVFVVGASTFSSGLQIGGSGAGGAASNMLIDADGNIVRSQGNNNFFLNDSSLFLNLPGGEATIKNNATSASSQLTLKTDATRNAHIIFRPRGQNGAILLETNAFIINNSTGQFGDSMLEVNNGVLRVIGGSATVSDVITSGKGFIGPSSTFNYVSAGTMTVTSSGTFNVLTASSFTLTAATFCVNGTCYVFLATAPFVSGDLVFHRSADGKTVYLGGDNAGTSSGGSSGGGGVWISSMEFRFNQPASTIVFVGAFIDSVTFQTGVATVTINGNPFWVFSSTTQNIIDNFKLWFGTTSTAIDGKISSNQASIIFSTNIANANIYGDDIAAGTVGGTQTVRGINGGVLSDLNNVLRASHTTGGLIGNLIPNGVQVIAASMTNLRESTNTWVTQTISSLTVTSSATIGGFTTVSSFTITESSIGTRNYTIVFTSVPTAVGQHIVVTAISGTNITFGAGADNAGTSSGGSDNMGSHVSTRTIDSTGQSIRYSTSMAVGTTEFALVSIASANVPGPIVAITTGVPGRDTLYEMTRTSMTVNVSTSYINGALVVNAVTSDGLPSTINGNLRIDGGSLTIRGGGGIESSSYSILGASLLYSTATAALPNAYSGYVVWVSSSINLASAGTLVVNVPAGFTKIFPIAVTEVATDAEANQVNISAIGATSYTIKNKSAINAKNFIYVSGIGR